MAVPGRPRSASVSSSPSKPATTGGSVTRMARAFSASVGMGMNPATVIANKVDAMQRAAEVDPNGPGAVPFKNALAVGSAIFKASGEPTMQPTMYDPKEDPRKKRTWLASLATTINMVGGATGKDLVSNAMNMIKSSGDPQALAQAAQHFMKKHPIVSTIALKVASMVTGGQISKSVVKGHLKEMLKPDQLGVRPKPAQTSVARQQGQEAQGTRRSASATQTPAQAPQPRPRALSIDASKLNAGTNASKLTSAGGARLPVVRAGRALSAAAPVVAALNRFKLGS